MNSRSVLPVVSNGQQSAARDVGVWLILESLKIALKTHFG
jgi:hypothetical protein